MTALEDSKESINECAKRWGNYKRYVPVPKGEADEIKEKAAKLKADKDRRLTQTRRDAEFAWELAKIERDGLI